ncbi:hypothetical protein F3Y22_tig00110895pilonHSYRG00658 [Hibiscus syriacus]|uniref:Uncharacterized protein n=1 Tax=Hibiscus syriacus TaxID=106335 RepID=A0A6A2ZG14_HIBSY|nr:hypothetical protein F3Y22_tig00110895pilonHSYRG00658 [Hibiscus syriacus]
MEIKIPGLDKAKSVELSAGEIHDFVFQAVDESGNARCLGGDYFEVDLFGDSWKRPLVKDFGNGSYLVSLQGLGSLKLELNCPNCKFAKNLISIEMFGLVDGLDMERMIIVELVTTADINAAPDFPCLNPWCNRSLGLLESNGWVYSSHCLFRLVSVDSGWDCLKNRFDMNFSNPKDRSPTVQITSIFNGHCNGTQNYLGLDSLKDEGFRSLLNIVLERHSGIGEAERVISATSCFPVHPSKVEAFNGVVLEKLRQAGLVSSVIDNFDMTYSWHYDNRCNYGFHYGRAPLKMKWRDEPVLGGLMSVFPSGDSPGSGLCNTIVIETTGLQVAAA